MTKKKSQRRDWRMIVFVVISLMMVLLMVGGAVLPALFGN